MGCTEALNLRVMRGRPAVYLDAVRQLLFQDSVSFRPARHAVLLRTCPPRVFTSPVRVVRRNPPCPHVVAGRSDLVVHPPGQGIRQPPSGTAVAVVNEYRRLACQHIVRVLRILSLPAFSQVNRYSAVR